MPVLTRFPRAPALGMMTDKFGGRPVFFTIMALTVVPIPHHRPCHPNTGNSSSPACSSASPAVPSRSASPLRPLVRQRIRASPWAFSAPWQCQCGGDQAGRPSIVVPAAGWTMVPTVYAVMMLVTALAFWLFTYSDPAPRSDPTSPSASLEEALKDPNVWKICQYYSIVFGGYVALSLWMTRYYVQEYSFDLKTAAFLAPASPCRACFAHWAAGCLRTSGVAKVTWVGAVGELDVPLSSCRTRRPVHHQDRERAPDLASTSNDVFTGLMFVVGVPGAIGKASCLQSTSPTTIPTSASSPASSVWPAAWAAFSCPSCSAPWWTSTGIRSSCFMLMAAWSGFR